METYNQTCLREERDDDDSEDQAFNRPYVNSMAQPNSSQANNDQHSNTYINLLKVNSDVFNSGWLQAVRSKNNNNNPVTYINNDLSISHFQHPNSSFDGNNNNLNKNNGLLQPYSPTNNLAINVPSFKTVFRTSSKDVNHISNGKANSREYLNVMSDGVEEDDYKDIDLINKSDALTLRLNHLDGGINNNNNIIKNNVMKNNIIYNANNVVKNTNTYYSNNDSNDSGKHLHYIQLDLSASAASSPNATPNQHDAMRNRGANGSIISIGNRGFPRSRSPNDKYTLIDFTKTQAISKNRQGDSKPSGG